jgi:hypothetical protein
MKYGTTSELLVSLGHSGLFTQDNDLFIGFGKFVLQLLAFKIWNCNFIAQRKETTEKEGKVRKLPKAKCVCI